MTRVLERPASWWLQTLRKRAQRTGRDELTLAGPAPYADAHVRRAALKFFNAAYRAEQAGIRQAHALARGVEGSDPELAELLRLYGDEEGWHRELLEGFLKYLGGQVQPMGRVTRLLFEAHGRAKRLDTVVLANLMFETIGSATYRLTLSRVDEPQVRRMLTILTRDESFHVPLNVYFLRRVLEHDRSGLLRLRLTHRLLFVALTLLPLASRPKSQAFDGIPALELMRSYALELAALFVDDPELPLSPPWWLLSLLGLRRSDVRSRGTASMAAAMRAADRDQVVVTPL